MPSQCGGWSGGGEETMVRRGMVMWTVRGRGGAVRQHDVTAVAGDRAVVEVDARRRRVADGFDPTWLSVTRIENWLSSDSM
jgi:hypothetical protein